MSDGPSIPGFDADLPDPSRTLALVGRARGGDREAVEELVDRYQQRLLRIARLHLGPRLRSHLESMDIVQGANQVFLRKVQDLDSSDPAALLRFLTKVVLNQVRDAHDHFHAKKRDVDRRVELEGADGEGEPGAGEGLDRLAVSQTSPFERAARREARDLLDAAVDGLPDDQRQVIVQRDYGAVDWSDIAEGMGRTEGAVRMLHKRAWDALRASLLPRLKSRDPESD